MYKSRYRFRPPVAPEVTPADHDLGRLFSRGHAIVAEAAFETPGDSDRDGMQLAAEALGVERRMGGRQARFSRGIFRTSRLSSPFPNALARDREGHQHPSRCRAFGARTATDERRDSLQHVGRCRQKRTVHSQGTVPVADHDGAIPRETQRSDTAKTESRQLGQQLVGSSRREGQFELRSVLMR